MQRPAALAQDTRASKPHSRFRSLQPPDLFDFRSFVCIRLPSPAQSPAKFRQSTGKVFRKTLAKFQSSFFSCNPTPDCIRSSPLPFGAFGTVFKAVSKCFTLESPATPARTRDPPAQPLDTLHLQLSLFKKIDPFGGRPARRPQPAFARLIRIVVHLGPSSQWISKAAHSPVQRPSVASRK